MAQQGLPFGARVKKKAKKLRPKRGPNERVKVGGYTRRFPKPFTRKRKR